ncbi:hypothetical protein WMY93_004264 [Mugilogobius chulae]|uniref:Ig-like domain-containing protein n=1 Tax=Mugilogobius chulae TaxID=88201 RepID=A0AAW0PQL0_9GOBI
MSAPWTVRVDECVCAQREPAGIHVWQRVWGCDWDDKTDDIFGYDQCRFDGKDYISFDWKTKTWATVEPFTDAGQENADENIRFDECIKKLRILLYYGEKTLKRTAPRVSFLQKSSSSSVVCHATGFFPDRAMLFWTKDGHELLEDVVDPGEILPNADGTFQTSVSLNLSSVPPEDWGRYHCVFQLSGVKDDYVTRLDRTNIRTNVISANPPSPSVGPAEPHCSNTALVVVLGIFTIVTIAAVVVFVIKRKKNPGVIVLDDTLLMFRGVANLTDLSNWPRLPPPGGLWRSESASAEHTDHQQRRRSFQSSSHMGFTSPETTRRGQAWPVGQICQIGHASEHPLRDTRHNIGRHL